MLSGTVSLTSDEVNSILVASGYPWGKFEWAVGQFNAWLAANWPPMPAGGLTLNQWLARNESEKKFYCAMYMLHRQATASVNSGMKRAAAEAVQTVSLAVGITPAF